MMGRAAYQEPWRLLAVDPLLFGEPAPFASPKAAALALMPYIERELVARRAAAFHHASSARPVPGGAGRARLPPASRDRGGQARRMRRGSGRGAGAGGRQDLPNWRKSPRPDRSFRGDSDAVRCPAGEIALLVAAVMVGGVVTGILAGLFGIGGGAIIVPVLYEVFRILGVPEEVRMQLCVGTSMAIIVPTTIRSYLTHRAKGWCCNDVMRALGAAGRAGRRRRLA